MKKIILLFFLLAFVFFPVKVNENNADSYLKHKDIDIYITDEDSSSQFSPFTDSNDHNEESSFSIYDKDTGGYGEFF